MGFFSTLLASGKTLLQDAEVGLKKLTGAKTLSHVVAGSFMVAMADNDFSDEEKVMLQKVLQAKLPQYKPAEIAKAVNAAQDEYAFSPVAGKINLMAKVSEAAGNQEEARLVMLAVLAVANADNEFSDVEKNVTREICRTLGLRASEYGL